MSFSPRLSAVFALLVSASVQAQVTNGNFETGNLSGWSSIGNTSAGGAFMTHSPQQGSFQGVIATSGGGTVFRPQLESFLGLTAGSLNSLQGTLANGGGSALTQTITVAAGAMIQFAWNFVPAGAFSVSANDSVFFTLHLAAAMGTFADVIVLDRFSNHMTGMASGYAFFTTGPLAAGTYLLGFGAFDAVLTGTDPGNSNLLLDSVTVINPPAAGVPETGRTLLLLACASGALFLARRRWRLVR